MEEGKVKVEHVSSQKLLSFSLVEGEGSEAVTPIVLERTFRATADDATIGEIINDLQIGISIGGEVCVHFHRLIWDTDNTKPLTFSR